MPKHPLYIGAHASISPSILAGVEYIHSIGGNVVQIFSGPSQMTTLKAKQPVEHPEQIREFLKRNGMKLVIHAIYTLNFCAYPATSARIKYAHANLIYDMKLAQRIGGSGVVLHIGSKVDLTEEVAYENMVSNIKYLLDQTRADCPDVFLALETPAGQGSQIAADLAGLRRLFQAVGSRDKRLGLCIDTAHLFSSGLDIRKPAVLKEYLAALDEPGLPPVKVIHLNDSKVGLGSRRDMHEGLREGHLFKDAPFDELIAILLDYAKSHGGTVGCKRILHSNGTPIVSLSHPDGVYDNSRLCSIPIVLETHKAGAPGNEYYAQEIAMLRGKPATRRAKPWSLIKTRKAKLANIGLLRKFRELREYYTQAAPDKFRALAYGKAVMALQAYPEEIVRAEQVAHLPGIGPQILKKIDEYLTEGEIAIFKSEAIREKLGAQKQQVGAILGFGPARVKALAKQGIHTVDDLRRRQQDVKLSPTEQIGLEHHADLMKLIPRRETEAMFKGFKRCMPPNAHIELAGSYPSGKAESKDIDILFFTDDTTQAMAQVMDALTRCKLLVAVQSSGTGKLLALVRLDAKHPVRHLDVRILPRNAEVFGRFYFTSGRDFNQMVRAHAKQQGYKLNEFGLYDMRHGGKAVEGITSEKELMEVIGLAYVPMIKRR